MPRLDGKVAVVTGANRGLGLEIAGALAAAGAAVVMACRDPEKAVAARQEVLARAPRADAEALALDLASLASIRAFAEALRSRHDRLDLLVNNASAILVPEGRTRDGFETHFGTNHLGSFALTGLLIDPLLAAPAARIVNTSSSAHRLTRGLDFDDLAFERSVYKPMEAYGRSKLATLLFTFELDRRLRRAGAAAVAMAAHPGYSNTNPDKGGLLMRLATALVAQPGSMGALPALYAASAPGVQGGDYYGPGGLAEMRGWPAKAGCAPAARDPATAARLWEVSAGLTGVGYLV
jgi:NAD(P)-dependent dehydrogenase (short-subunit alcohol dehydrogenase family)